MSAPIKRVRAGQPPLAREQNRLIDAVNRLLKLTGDGVVQVNHIGGGVTVGLDITQLKVLLGQPAAPLSEIGFDLYIDVQATTSGRLSLEGIAPGDWRGRVVTLRIGTIDDEPVDADAFIWSLPPALGGQFDAARPSHGVRTEVVGKNLAGNELLYTVEGARIIFDLYVDAGDGHLSIDVTTLTGQTTVRMLIEGTRQRQFVDDDTPDLTIS